MGNFEVAAFYKFTPVDNVSRAKEELDDVLTETDVRGTILVADEGVNGTIAGPAAQIQLALDAIRKVSGGGELDYKVSYADENPFYRLKVRLKKEIVTMGVPGIDPNSVVGTYVEPEEWNDLIQSKDVVVIDTRNDYEVSIGTFDGAVDPHTTTFREFPKWFDEFRKENTEAKIAMFCTGGIRCEKASSYVKQQGVSEVFHLKGGILKYLERIPEDQSLWKGDCFVFDNRVSVTHGLEVGDYDMCHACRRPISAEDKKSELFVQGVSCPYCYDETNGEQRRRYKERQKQIDLAKERGQQHIGISHHYSDGNRKA